VKAREDCSSITGQLESPALFTDDELADLAMSANPDEPLDAGAVPIDIYFANTVSSLPEWYMAPVMTRNSGRFVRVVILAVIASFLLIEAFGLCSTYGQIPFH
jgi:hypothetical protein